MYQYWFINYKKCITLMQDVNNRVHCWGLGEFIQELYIFCSIFSEHKSSLFNRSEVIKQKVWVRTCWVVQWLRIHLPMQGTWSLVPEDSRCHRATKPMPHNHRPYSRVCLSQLLKPEHPRPHGTQKEKLLRWEACAPQLEKAHV